MSKLSELINHARTLDPELADELNKELTSLHNKRQFGLVWENHGPEYNRNYLHPVRKGCMVHILPERGKKEAPENNVIWNVIKTKKTPEGKVAHLSREVEDEIITTTHPVADLVTVVKSDQVIYPGLKLDDNGVVTNGEEDDPSHVVINAENYDALTALTYTHRNSIDCIYIDPPYNTGARDWKYNNDYVDRSDGYRHSKFLTFLERRLKVAKELLNPEDSVLILTIDEKEYLRVGLLLEQVFPESRIQMVSSVIDRKGSHRKKEFARVDEYLFFVMLGDSGPDRLPLTKEWFVSGEIPYKGRLHWDSLRRTGTGALRTDSPGLYYPVHLTHTDEGSMFHSVGEQLPLDIDRDDISTPEGADATVWPIREDGSEGRWQLAPSTLRELISKGYVKLGGWRGNDTTIYYLARGNQSKVKEGFFSVIGRAPDGSVIVEENPSGQLALPGTQWNLPSHQAGTGGSNLIRSLLGDKRFDYPKSLYAVEDAIRFFVKDKPEATILDFFSGSGTTAHAVMRLNQEDGGKRRSISVTNNEVSDKEEKAFTKKGLRPSDDEWFSHGICEYVTKPRIRAAITGLTPQGNPVKGEYKYNHQSAITDGIPANARFYTLTYETQLGIDHGLSFDRLAPLLWMKSGQNGPVINSEDMIDGWCVTDYYGIISNLSVSEEFISEVKERSVNMVFVLSDDDLRFQSIAAEIPGVRVEPLFGTYINNFRSLNR